MNNSKKLLAGLASVALLASCSQNEGPDFNGGNVAEGDNAYLAVNIQAADNGTRSTTAGDYQPSWDVAAEHAVSSARFFFYDADGNFVLEAKAVSPEFDQNGTTGKPNVEYIGKKSIVVLEGLKGNSYPNYVITVLNAPTFKPEGLTMQQVSESLIAYNNGQMVENPSEFVMSTTSYNGETTNHDAIYYATKLAATDFKLSREEAAKDANAVNIYVERLAAKVQVRMGSNGNDVITVGDKKYYKLPVTLAGDLNSTENGNVESGSPVADVNLYITVNGWGLNGLTQNSSISKQLDSSWASNAPFANWNNASDFRSFWGKSEVYGNDNAASKLFFLTPSQLGKAAGFDSEAANIAYCYENTNQVANLVAEQTGGAYTLNGKSVGVVAKNLTHVVLSAKVCQKKADNTMAPAALVSYRGLLYTNAGYKSVVLKQLDSANALNLYTQTTTTTEGNVTKTEWKQIDGSFLKMGRKANGKVGEIVYEYEKPASVEKVYTKEANGNYKEATEAEITTLKNKLAEVQANNNATGTMEGDVLYYIPVEHLAAQGTALCDGYFGVVRNHWYQITVNNFKRIGHLVFDPKNDTTTKIIPDEPEDPLYYVGAKINILSWKIVNQEVNDL